MEYTTKSFNELKQLLKEKGLSTIGKKVDLIERLNEHDKQIEADKKRFKVYVKTLVGAWYPIYIESSSTIAELKDKINEKSGCPPRAQLLYLTCYDKPQIGDVTYQNGTTGKMIIDDTKTLSDYGAMNESIFNLHMRLIK